MKLLFIKWHLKKIKNKEIHKSKILKEKRTQIHLNIKYIKKNETGVE